MKRTAIAATAPLFMCLAALSYAQQPAHDSGAQEQQPTETKPPKEQPETKPPKAEKHETPKPSNEQQKPTGNHGTSAQQQRQVRPAGKGGHIPDPQFKANFGRQHAFPAKRVITTTTIVPNQTRFVVSGFTFVFLGPWPPEWLFTDDCFIDFVDDEYFLFDVLHPGVRVALLVIE